MAKNFKIIIADKSVLAANLYKLLLSQTGVLLKIYKRFAEAVDEAESNGSDIIIFSSNTFGSKFDDLLKIVDDDSKKITGAKKIFICKDSDQDSERNIALSNVKNSLTLVRPFHPDELTGVVQKAIEQGVLS